MHWHPIFKYQGIFNSTGNLSKIFVGMQASSCNDAGDALSYHIGRIFSTYSETTTLGLATVWYLSLNGKWIQKISEKQVYRSS